MSGRRILAVGAALALTVTTLTGCILSFDEISFGTNRELIRGKGEDRQLVNDLVYAEDVGAHTLSIEDIYFLDGGMEIKIDPSLADKVTLEAPQNLLDTIEVSIDHEAGVIRISGDDKVNFRDADLEITVGVPVDDLSITGGAELEVDQPDLDRFTLDVVGAVDGELDFGRLDTLHIYVAGAGSIEVSGTCSKAELTVEGAGSIDADDLICTDAVVKIAGAGSCDIYVTDTLDAEVDGVGAIRYSGDPKNVNKSGGGIVAVKER